MLEKQAFSSINRTVNRYAGQLNCNKHFHN